ncbi:MAG: nitroreductase [Eubacterium sp.]|nr:nitroreductase [Eubacterium sp.]
MNEVLKVIAERRSCRKFKDDPIPKEIIEQVCEAGAAAPTGMNRQECVIIAVTDKEVRDELSKLNAAVFNMPNDPFYGANTVIVVLADKSSPTYLYDGTLVLGNMMIAAQALGLGGTWIHRAKEEFDSEYGKELLKKLGVEGDYEGIGNLILGYPDAEPAPKARTGNKVYYV